MTNREEKLQNPFFAPKEKYDDNFISGYSNAIYHMREAIGHIQFQNDTKELRELFLYSRLLIEKLNEKFGGNNEQAMIDYNKMEEEWEMDNYNEMKDEQQ